MRRGEISSKSVSVWIRAETTIILMSETNSLAELLRVAGAGSAMHYFQAVHELTPVGLESAHEWLKKLT